MTHEAIQVNIISFHSLFILWSNRLSVRQWSWRMGFNPRSSHTKDSEMVFDADLLNPRHYKVRIKGKVEQSREWSCALPYTFNFQVKT